MSQLRQSGKEQIPLRPAFLFLQASNDVDEGQPHWGGQSALLRALIQIFISSRNFLSCLLVRVHQCRGLLFPMKPLSHDWTIPSFKALKFQK